MPTPFENSSKMSGIHWRGQIIPTCKIVVKLFCDLNPRLVALRFRLKLPVTMSCYPSTMEHLSFGTEYLKHAS
jgi:hypothetical protein